MAGNIKGIIVEIGGDTSGLQKALTNAQKITNGFARELGEVNKALKLDPGNTELLNQKWKSLTNESAALEKQLRYLKEEYADVNDYVKKGNILTEDQQKKYEALAREIVTVESKLKNVKSAMNEFGSVTAQKIALAGQKVQEFGNKVGVVADKFMKVSLAAAGLMTGITKIAIDFESAWTGVTKTVDGTEEELATIKKGIFTLSEATASSAEEIAQVAENAGQLGVATKNILGFTETMVRLGDSTNVSADEAATAIAQLYNVTGSDINTVDKFGSTLVALGNNAATTENDILNMASRIAASGSQVGLTNQEILALSTTLASVGLEAEGGGSAISAVITAIDKDVATNGKTLKTWAQTAGMSTKEFKKAWKTDTIGAIQKIVTGMSSASSSGKNLNVVLDNLGVTSLRQTDTMKRLAGASELLGGMVTLSNEAWDKNTALTDESNKRYQTAEAQISQLKATFTELAVQLGEVLLPKVMALVEKIKVVVNWFINLDSGIQSTIVTVLGIVAALAPVIKVISTLNESIGAVLEFAPKIVSWVGKIKKVITVITTVIGGISTPVLVVVGVIAALVAAFVLLYKKCEWFRNGVNNIVTSIIGFFTALPENISNAITTIGEKITEIGTTIWEWVTTTIPQIIQGIGTFFEELPNKIEYALGYAIGTIIGWGLKIDTWVVTELPKIIGKIVEWFASLPSKIWDFLVAVVTKIIEWGLSVDKYMVSLIGKAIEKVVTFFKELPGRIWDFLKAAYEKVKEWLTNMYNTVKEKIPEVSKAIYDTLSKLPEQMLNIGKNIVEGLWNGIKNAKDWLFEKIGSFATGIVDGFQNALQIHSPSKLFRDEVGKYIAQGIGVRF